jgi:hypothetical protein
MHPDHTTVVQGDTLPDVADRLGVDEKTVTDTGVLDLKPGQVIDVASNKKRRDAIEAAARTQNQQVGSIDTQIADIQSSLDNLAPGARGPQKTQLEETLAQLQLDKQTLLGQTPTSQMPSATDYQSPFNQPLTEPLETPVSQFHRFINRLRQDIGIIVDEPEPVHYTGMSPEDVEAAEFQRMEQFRDEQTARFFEAFGEENVQPVTQATGEAQSPEQVQEYLDLIERGNAADVFAAQQEGYWLTDATGKRIFVSQNWGEYYKDEPIPGMPQRVVDAMGAKFNSQAMQYAIETEDWNLLPTSISAGAAQHIVGTPYGYSFEEMSLLGYNQDEFGNWVHEVVDTDVQFSPGFGGGGYGGYGGGGGYEPNKNTYAGGRAETLSGKHAGRQQAQRGAGGLGATNWRI